MLFAWAHTVVVCWWWVAAGWVVGGVGWLGGLRRLVGWVGVPAVLVLRCVFSSLFSLASAAGCPVFFFLLLGCVVVPFRWFVFLPVACGSVGVFGWLVGPPRLVVAFSCVLRVSVRVCCARLAFGVLAVFPLFSRASSDGYGRLVGGWLVERRGVVRVSTSLRAR